MAWKPSTPAEVDNHFDQLDNWNRLGVDDQRGTEGRHVFLYIATPLRLAGGPGWPVPPLAFFSIRR